MGVYIDMEMPKKGCIKMLVLLCDGKVIETTPGCQPQPEKQNYKAAPVPPHGRLGDLDKLEQTFVDIDNAPYSGFDGLEPFYSAEDAAQIIRLAPTIIPAEGGET